MRTHRLPQWLHWTLSVPAIAVVLLAATWGRDPGLVLLVIEGAFLIGAVIAAVIEVALIVTLMLSGKGDTSTLARDTVFSAVMLSMNGIVGISVLVGARRHHPVVFNAEGTGSALATVVTLAGLHPRAAALHHLGTRSVFSTSQLTFAAIASLALYGLFVFTQTVRHRDF